MELDKEGKVRPSGVAKDEYESHCNSQIVQHVQDQTREMIQS